MSRDNLEKEADAAIAGFDTGSHREVYDYYARQSADASTLQRFKGIRDAVLRVLAGDSRVSGLDVIDVGCGAGAQSCLWTERGHRYVGIDINEPLIQLAKQRFGDQLTSVSFQVGTATDLPCAGESFDVCLLPELLEHVAEWQKCVGEAMRVLRPGGVLYASTTSRLCPVQQEFNLPLYSWYPPRVQRYFVRRAMSDRPELANYAKYPAFHWFSFYQLRDYFEQHGFSCFDRFDLVDREGKGRAARALLALIQAIPPLRFVGHVFTPATIIVAKKRSAVT